MKYFILGKVLPSIPENFHETDKYHREDDFSRDEVKKLNLVGLDLQINHSSELIAGKIIRQFYRDYDGSLWIIAEIDSTKPRGKLAIEIIKSKNFMASTDLSLGHIIDVWTDYKEGEVKVEKTPIEVSVLPRARRECGTCKIYSISSGEKLKSKIGTYIICGIR